MVVGNNNECKRTELKRGTSVFTADVDIGEDDKTDCFRFGCILLYLLVIIITFLIIFFFLLILIFNPKLLFTEITDSIDKYN